MCHRLRWATDTSYIVVSCQSYFNRWNSQFFPLWSTTHFGKYNIFTAVSPVRSSCSEDLQLKCPGGGALWWPVEIPAALAVSLFPGDFWPPSVVAGYLYVMSAATVSSTSISFLALLIIVMQVSILVYWNREHGTVKSIILIWSCLLAKLSPWLPQNCSELRLSSDRRLVWVFQLLEFWSWKDLQ